HSFHIPCYTAPKQRFCKRCVTQCVVDSLTIKNRIRTVNRFDLFQAYANFVAQGVSFCAGWAEINQTAPNAIRPARQA
ncbi:MAG TPA: hypothetical protein P5559_10585, partial [Candidatus Limiplasma sp.]|nr:hypothetical protein [Candidatus Limiplasma sp.]